ncbi:MAG TPA: hypothetical protein VM031_05670, partial [Phycisphaerae bacterium]|nr:hypothetical protein [Phycisphaerae bacterium]
AHPDAADLRGKVAVMRGPVVYCLESPDLPEGTAFGDVAIPASIELVPHFQKDLLGGVTVLRGKAARRSPDSPGLPAPSKAGWEGRLYRDLRPSRRGAPPGESIDVTLVPYFAWANRGVSQMAVWLPRR